MSNIDYSILDSLLGVLWVLLYLVGAVLVAVIGRGLGRWLGSGGFLVLSLTSLLTGALGLLPRLLHGAHHVTLSDLSVTRVLDGVMEAIGWILVGVGIVLMSRRFVPPRPLPRPMGPMPAGAHAAPAQWGGPAAAQWGGAPSAMASAQPSAPPASAPSAQPPATTQPSAPPASAPSAQPPAWGATPRPQGDFAPTQPAPQGEQPPSQPAWRPRD